MNRTKRNGTKLTMRTLNPPIPFSSNCYQFIWDYLLVSIQITFHHQRILPYGTQGSATINRTLSSTSHRHPPHKTRARSETSASRSMDGLEAVSQLMPVFRKHSYSRPNFSSTVVIRKELPWFVVLVRLLLVHRLHGNRINIIISNTFLSFRICGCEGEAKASSESNRGNGPAPPNENPSRDSGSGNSL